MFLDEGSNDKQKRLERIAGLAPKKKTIKQKTIKRLNNNEDISQ